MPHDPDNFASSRVDFIGQLSNPVGPLKVLLEGKRSEDHVPREVGQPAPVAARHPQIGWVVEAIERVLRDRAAPMQAKDVHAAVEAALGRPVSWSSVKNALVAGISGRSPRFVRIAKGRYRLREP